MKTALVILLVLAIPLSVRAENYGPEQWTWGDTALEGTFLVLTAMDWRQTFAATRGSRMYETNPILGQHPEALTVHSVFVATACLHLLGALGLPPEYRHIWQAVGIGFEANSVGHNLALGVGFGW
jgi:hypothetical protein